MNHGNSFALFPNPNPFAFCGNFAQLNATYEIGYNKVRIKKVHSIIWNGVSDAYYYVDENRFNGKISW